MKRLTLSFLCLLLGSVLVCTSFVMVAQPAAAEGITRDKEKIVQTAIPMPVEPPETSAPIPMNCRTSRSVAVAPNRLKRKYGAAFYKIFQTITVDNGSEFADCQGIEKSCRRKGNRTKVYYCHPLILRMREGRTKI